MNQKDINDAERIIFSRLSRSFGLGPTRVDMDRDMYEIEEQENRKINEYLRYQTSQRE
jgi:hypothetical protein